MSHAELLAIEYPLPSVSSDLMKCASFPETRYEREHDLGSPSLRFSFGPYSSPHDGSQPGSKASRDLCGK